MSTSAAPASFFASDFAFASALALALALLTVSCASPVTTPTLVGVGEVDTTLPGENVDDPGDAGDPGGPGGGKAGPVVTVKLPPIPPIALPDLSTLGDTGDLVAERLGDLVTPISGVEVVAAKCQNDGGVPVYSGSLNETDVFEIEDDGSGSYREERDNGLVTLDVAADGSGRYYQESGQGLVTIDVEADGSGRYYSKQGRQLITVERAADGSGRYYDDTDGLLTVVISEDGSGQYYRSTDEDGLLTIAADSDGTGEYYLRQGDDVITIVVSDDGAWVLSQVAAEHRLEVRVEADGSGRYIRTGLRPLSLEFDSAGLAADGGKVEIDGQPDLAVAGRFPPLGRLGSLSPPCAAVIRLDSALLFEFDEWSIRPEASTTLEEVAAALIDAGKPVEVNGHTDSFGTEEYNLKLSRRRAEAVERALRSRGLTTPIKINGYGETQPVANENGPDGEDDPTARAKNRRVEIVVPESN